MNNKVIDFTYALEKQKTFSKLLEDKKGIKQPSDIYNVPYSFILGLNSELYEIVNAAKMHKSYSKEKIDRDHVIEECADLLSWIGNTANFLEVKLITEVQEIQALQGNKYEKYMKYNFYLINKVFNMDNKIIEKILSNIMTDINLLLWDYNLKATEEEIVDFLCKIIERQEYK